MAHLKGFVPKRVKRWLPHTLPIYYRLATSKFRASPDFIIIGAQKSGTSSLFHFLSQHPQILPSHNKEVHFFDGGLEPGINNYLKGLAWYRAHFPIQWTRRKKYISGEASPLYIFNPLVPRRLYKTLPNIKLIAILRNPSDRAVSHYFHEKRKGRETLSLMEALESEEERIDQFVKKRDYKNFNFIHFSYKKRGIYKEQLERYFSLFDRENILILNSEEFFENPRKVLSEIFNFLGVNIDAEIRDLSSKNVTINREKVEDCVYEYLNKYFSMHNEELFEFLNRRFDW